jgi:hypothetical protein
MKETIGNYFLDISKLIFAGVVLSAVLDLDVSKISVLFVGIYATSVFALMGFLFLRRK